MGLNRRIFEMQKNVKGKKGDLSILMQRFLCLEKIKLYIYKLQKKYIILIYFPLFNFVKIKIRKPLME